MDKNRNKNYNRYADEMLSKIDQCVKQRLQKISDLETAVVESVNSNGTVNIFFPPNKENIFTNINNQTPFTLNPGDSVEVMKKFGSWSNCWIIAKHGSTNATGIEEQQKIVKTYYSNSSSGGTGSSGGSSISTSVKFSADLQTGVKIGTITIDGQATDIYVPQDTHWNSKNIIGNSATTIDNTSTKLENDQVHLNSVENGSVTSSHKIVGAGSTKVTTDEKGNIIISSTDTNIVDNLTSTSTDKALSANQGKILKDEVDKKAPKATTLSGYGIADAKIEGGIITIGSNTIKPITDVSDKAPLNNPAFTGTPTAPTATEGTNSTQIATTAFVNNSVSKSITKILENTKTMTFEGTLGTNGTIQALPSSHTIGDVYIIITSGTYAGVKCGEGDLIICINTGITDNNDDWYVIQTTVDLSGIETGIITQGKSSPSHVPIYVDNTGGIVKDSGFTIGTSVPEEAVFTDTVTEVVDNLTSIESDKALSANQGKILNEKKAPLESPTFSGVPTAPTAGNNTNSAQVATTAFVKNNLDNFLQVSSNEPINGAKLWFKVLS